MLTIKDEIYMTTQEIERKTSELLRLNPHLPENRFKFANVRSELFILNRKLDKLKKQEQEEYNLSHGIPFIGDSKYSNLPHKNSLDELRIRHFKLFKKDPDITYGDNKAMFDDDTLPIYADFYNIKNAFPFKLIYSSSDCSLVSDNKASLGISISKEQLLSAKDEEVKFLVDFIKDYTRNQVNFIYTNEKLDEVFLSHIGDKDFHYFEDQKSYYLFFSELFNNLYRNVIYTGESLKKDAPDEEIINAKSELIIPYHEVVAKVNNITNDMLLEENNKIKMKILKHN